MILSAIPPYSFLPAGLFLWILTAASGYAQPVPSLPLTPATNVRVPSAASPDERFQQLWEAMRERVPMVDDLLLQGRAGEGADGYLAAPPDVNLSSEEKTQIQDENALRRRVYEEMAALTGGQARDMGEQRALRFSHRLKKGIYREVISTSGTSEWADGYTDEERIKTYVLDFAAPPPERVEATKSFSILLQVKDGLGRPAAHRSLTGTSFSVASARTSDGLAGQSTAPLENGVAHFTGLTFPAVISPTKLIFNGHGALEQLKLETPVITVLEKTISPEDIETYMPAWERLADRLLQRPPGPARDRELTDFRRELERGIASILSFPMADPLTSQKLKEMHKKVVDALAISSPGKPETQPAH